ncbi:MAG: sodium-dependent transporter [Lachnospiraceae bacterium]|nr:sodium-dependent transporter [Lachnospiraceae bacterium]
MNERENFGSRLGFILVSAGCAIGLGNVWKFPYICGQYGGATFILIYLVFLAIIGLPIIICEFSVGRGSRKSVAKSFDELQPKGQKWHMFKWIGILGSYILMMFYTMVGGWMMYYAYNMMSGKLFGMSNMKIIGVFEKMLQSPGTLTFWMVVVTVLSFGCVALGLQNGVEKVTKVMMSVLLVMMVVLAINSVTLGNAGAGIKFYLVPSMAGIKQHGLGTVVFAAMTHAFFTLSVGIGSMSIFGSYLPKERKLTGEALSIVFVDTFVALVAGLIIIPACFAYGVQPDAGPSLLFITLPNVFNHMGAGRIWGSLFFVFMTFAAMSTIIAVFESIIAACMELTGKSRTQCVMVNAVALIILSMPCILGYNILGGIHPIGDGSTIMDLEDFLVSYNLLPLGSLIFVMFCTAKSGWGFDRFLEEVNTGTGMNFPRQVRGYMTYILPIIVVVVYLKGYYDMFAPLGKSMLYFWMVVAFLFLAFVFWFSRNHVKNKEIA